MEENKDGLSEYLRKAEEAANADVNDPDYEDKQREFAKSYIDSFVPKNHTTIINPILYKDVENAIAQIKRVVSESIKEGFGDDCDAEYSVGWGGFLKENLVFKITLKDWWISLKSIDFYETIPLLPVDFQLVVTPHTNGSVDIAFEFHNVKEVISQDRVPADDWFDEE